MSDQNQPQLLTDRAAAKMLSIGVSTFWRQVGKGSIPQPVKIGGSTRWRRSDIEALFAPAE